MQTVQAVQAMEREQAGDVTILHERLETLAHGLREELDVPHEFTQLRTEFDALRDQVDELALRSLPCQPDIKGSLCPLGDGDLAASVGVEEQYLRRASDGGQHNPEGRSMFAPSKVQASAAASPRSPNSASGCATARSIRSAVGL